MTDVAAMVPALFWKGIVPLALQAVLLLSAAALADRLLPRRVWPELRLAAGTILLLKLLLPPRLVSPIPWTHPLAAATGLLDALPAMATASETTLRWAIVASWTWLAGVLAALALLALGMRRLQRRWQAAEAPTDEIAKACRDAAARLGLATPPPVRLGAGLASPFVFGLLSPKVLLPSNVRAEDVEHALLHELAHVKRRDLVLSGLVAAIRVVYWFHPFVHVAAGRLAGLREICCDRTVARRLGPDATDYRRTLLGFAARTHRVALAALPMTGGASILARLAALETLERDRPRLRKALTLAAAILAFACAIPLAPAAERQAGAVADLVTRPPGCLQLRFLVLGRMAEERRRQGGDSPETP